MPARPDESPLDAFLALACVVLAVLAIVGCAVML